MVVRARRGRGSAPSEGAGRKEKGKHLSLSLLLFPTSDLDRPTTKELTLIIIHSQKYYRVENIA